MLKAKFLHSGTNPVWVAAFFSKSLKRAQVLDTDISSAVDKILQDEMDVVSCRVLGYLLLGVVRIYSKKVEYVLHDCEVLVKINKFVINAEDIARVETLRMSITIPDRLELDAFELDALEDAGGGHTAPPEEITLKAKEVVCKTGGFGLFSQEKFEEFDIGENSCSFDHHIVENVRLSHLMNTMDFEVFPPNSPIDLLERRDIFQSSIFSQKEPMNFDTVLLVDGVEKESVNLSGQNQQIIEDQAVKDIVPCEDEILEESSRISQEEYMDISMFSGREKEYELSVEAFNESHKVDTDQSTAKETLSSLCKMNHEIIGVHEAKSFQESIEKPEGGKSCGRECVRDGNSSVAKEIHEELIEGFVEKHDNKGKLEFQEKVSLEDERLSVIPPKSKILDVAPQSKLQGGSVGRPKRGANTPELMLISTPALRERPHFSRKRVLDEMVVLPNKVLKKSICDASDLVSKRRKFRRTLLPVQRECLRSSLPNRFYEPLLPCSSQLHLLFSEKKVKISDSLQIVETLGNLDVSESQTVGSPEHIATAPITLPQYPGSLVIKETPRVLNVSESLASGSPRRIATAPPAPPTPTLCQGIKARPIEHPEGTEIQNLDNLEPYSPHESIEVEQSLERDEVLNLTDEEINSSGTENSELSAGWSNRTRKVASYLHQSFLHPRKQREEDVVNFSQVLGGRSRKESSKLFYEILVLKTTGYVDVEQNQAYGDIAISKLTKLDQAFLFDGILNDM